MTPWTVTYQAPLSGEFSRQGYWRGLPFPSPGDLPDPGIEPRSPALQADSLPIWATREAQAASKCQFLDYIWFSVAAFWTWGFRDPRSFHLWLCCPLVSEWFQPEQVETQERKRNSSIKKKKTKSWPGKDTFHGLMFHGEELETGWRDAKRGPSVYSKMDSYIRGTIPYCRKSTDFLGRAGQRCKLGLATSVASRACVTDTENTPFKCFTKYAGN